MIHDFDTSTRAAASSWKPQRSTDPVRVLVVNDESAVLWSIDQTLRSEGYITVTALDGASAVRAVERLGQFDLLITNLYHDSQPGQTI